MFQGLSSLIIVESRVEYHILGVNKVPIAGVAALGEKFVGIRPDGRIRECFRA